MKRSVSVLAGAGLMLTLAISNGYAAETNNSALVEKGKAAFDENCVACHQADGLGLPGTAPSLTNKDLLRNASDRFFAETIRDGRPDTPMPSFADVLKPEDIPAIIAYLRSFSVYPNRSAEIDAEEPATDVGCRRGRHLARGSVRGRGRP